MDKTNLQPVPSDAKETHVVFLVNFVAPNLIAVCQEISRLVGRLTVLSSVEMEANRDWKMDCGDLDVVVQKTWTITRNAKHPGGFREPNYIHLPTDTIGQLRALRPDAIVSLELGARTALASVYRMIHPQCKHIIAVYASERSEAGRGPLRRAVRRRLLARADWVTFNGPSCRRLLESLGADPNAMSPWNYASDPRKPFHGAIQSSGGHDAWQVLTVGQLSERKGIMPAIEQLSRWATENPDIRLHWNLVGGGPLESEIQSFDRPDNLTMTLHGHCEPEQIAHHYRDNDWLLFPTMADEWGLVVDEALISGLPVIGSCHSQAVTTLLADEGAGFVYDPEDPADLASVLNRAMRIDAPEWQRIAGRAREVGSARSPQASAQQFVDAIAMCSRRSLSPAVVS